MMEGQQPQSKAWTGVTARWNAGNAAAAPRASSSYVNFGPDGQIQPWNGLGGGGMGQGGTSDGDSYFSTDVYVSHPSGTFLSGSSSGTEGADMNEVSATAEDLFDGELANLRLDSKAFHIHSNLGQGFFADTYQATYSMPDGNEIEVAVKKIVLASFRQSNDLNLFVKEVGIWSKLNHPHIVKLLGYTINNADRYSVMELLGPSLHDALAQERQGKLQIPFEIKMVYAQQVASALAYMHAYHPPVLHRDLTPANVLLSLDLSLAKVGDFGLAREATAEGMTMTSAVGNCVCMAPEVFNGSKYNASADVYSFGILLYQMFVNPTDICQGFSPQVWASLASSERRRPPIEPLNELGIPPLSELIQACWHHDTRARPTFRDIVDFLASF
jgi:serine/threonine protein kinase